MAQIHYDFTFAHGRADEQFATELAKRSSDGWEIVGMTGERTDLVVCLRRERDFGVAQSLMHALEESAQPADAISTLEMPLEERTSSATEPGRSSE